MLRLTKYMFNGRRAENRLATSCKAIKPEKRIVPYQPIRKLMTIDQPQARVWMMFCTISTMVLR